MTEQLPVEFPATLVEPQSPSAGVGRLLDLEVVEDVHQHGPRPYATVAAAADLARRRGVGCDDAPAERALGLHSVDLVP
ncbi:MAG: hypothetical protein ACLGIR_01505 [Actinomycetes bacterium]